jgi:hypothetical protein
VWTGDVWKIIPCLREFRPDLRITTLGAAPSGLGVIQGLDPSSRVLEGVYDRAVERYRDLSYATLDEGPGKAEQLNLRAIRPSEIRRLWPCAPARPRTVRLRLARLLDESPSRAMWSLKRRARRAT